MHPQQQQQQQQQFTHYTMGANGQGQQQPSFSAVQNSQCSNQNSGGEKNGETSAEPAPAPVPTKTRKPYVITKQRERWTPEEHERFLEALQIFGRQWRKIEEYIGTKTAVQIRSHAQKFFTKIERETEKEGDGTGKKGHNPYAHIYIPPPRPKRKPSHPYPKKAKVPNNAATNGSAAGNASNYGEKGAQRGESSKQGGGKGGKQQQRQSQGGQQAQMGPYSHANGGQGLPHGAAPGASAAGPAAMIPAAMLDTLPYLTWLSQVGAMANGAPGAGLTSQQLLAAMATQNNALVMPTPHKILPGVVPLAGQGYEASELLHMHKLLMNAAEQSASKEDKEQALAAAQVIQQQIQQAANGASVTVAALGAAAPAPGSGGRGPQGASKRSTSPSSLSGGSLQRNTSAFVSTQAVGAAVAAAKVNGSAPADHRQKVEVKVEGGNDAKAAGKGGSGNGDSRESGSRNSPMVGTERASDSSGSGDGSGSTENNNNLRQMAPKSPSPQEGSLKKGVSPPLTSNGGSGGSSGNGSYGYGPYKEANGQGNNQEQQGSGSDHSNDQHNNGANNGNQAQSQLIQLLPKLTDPQQWANSYQKFCSQYSNAQFGQYMQQQQQQLLQNGQLTNFLKQAEMKALQDHHQQQQLRQQQQLLKESKVGGPQVPGENTDQAKGLGGPQAKKVCLSKGAKDQSGGKEAGGGLVRTNSGFMPYVKKAAQ